MVPRPLSSGFHERGESTSGVHQPIAGSISVLALIVIHAIVVTRCH
ncbi:MAG: hypothetical protein P8R46_02145 [Planctomycetota bacterium]|nr:hypothetical protein [Planctomycetota bacterium]